MCQKWQGLCSIWSNPNTYSWLTIGFVTWVTRHRWVPLLEHGLITLPDLLRSSQVFSDIRVAQAIVVCVVFCRSLFVLLFFFFCSLYCLSCFDLRFPITTFVSSNFVIVSLVFFFHLDYKSHKKTNRILRFFFSFSQI